MKFQKVTVKPNDVEMGVNPENICFLAKMPLQPDYTLACVGAVMEIDGLASPFATLCESLKNDSFPIIFITLPIPEGTDVLVNPKNIMTLVKTDNLGQSIILFPGGVKLIVCEGFETLTKQLSGEPTIEMP